MAAGVLYVETAPASPDQVGEYHRWYADVHVPEMLRLAGISSVRRFDTGGETYVAIYELDDVETAQSALQEALTSGAMSRPAVTRSDPPPTMRFFTTFEVFRAAEQAG